MQWHPTPVLLPGKSHGWRSLEGCSPWVAKSQTGLSDFTFTFHFHALEKEMATHSSVLAWRIPGTGEPGGLLSLGSHRVRHDWSDIAVAVFNTLSHVVSLNCDKFMRVNIIPLCSWRKVMLRERKDSSMQRHSSLVLLYMFVWMQHMWSCHLMSWDHSSEMAAEILFSGVEAAVHSFFHSFTESQPLFERLFQQRKVLS